MKRVILAALLAPALALAQAKSADDWYKEGEQHYNLGDFEKAAESFKAGFAAEQDESKKPAYLYNVAQSYRQLNRCRDSAFFYKRYLSLKDQDTAKPLKPEKRQEIEARIAELDECAKTQPGGGTTTQPRPGTGTTTQPRPGTGTTTQPHPGTGTTTQPHPGTGTTTQPHPGTGTTTQPQPGTGTTTQPGTGTTTQTRPATGTAETTVGVSTQTDATSIDATYDDGTGTAAWENWGDGAAPKFGTARFILGASKIIAGDIDMGTRASFTLQGGYPVFVKDKLLVEAGATFQYTPVPYKNAITDASHRASLVGASASGFGTYIVAPKISVRGELGLGMLFFGGIGEMGSPFTEDHAGTTGTLTMFAFRLAASADYEITKNLIATVMPFGLNVSPAKAGLRNDVGAITRLDFMLGVGYRM